MPAGPTSCTTVPADEAQPPGLEGNTISSLNTPPPPSPFINMSEYQNILTRLTNLTAAAVSAVPSGFTNTNTNTNTNASNNNINEEVSVPASDVEELLRLTQQLVLQWPNQQVSTTGNTNTSCFDKLAQPPSAILYLNQEPLLASLLL
jgi:hypothetical protein